MFLVKIHTANYFMSNIFVDYTINVESCFWETFEIYCGVEQLVARRAHNPEVEGSSPSPATKVD